MRNSIFTLSLLILTGMMACARAERNKKGVERVIYTKALYSRVSTLDPAQLTDTASLTVANQIYDGLLEFDSHFEIKPALAESWQTSEDGLTITFRLRPELKFHDGSSITSADCVRSFERLLDKKSLVFNYYDIIEGAVEFRTGKSSTVSGLSAPDERTFVIQLKNRFPPFPSILAGATAKILPKHAVDRPDFFQRPVGAGPFKITVNSAEEVVLARFPSYWREPAKLDELRFKILSEDKGLPLAKLGKLHDLVGYQLNGDEDVFTKGQHLSVPVLATWVIGLNVRLKPFDVLENRKAFRDAISAKDFAQKVYPGQTPALGGYLPPGLPGHLEEEMPLRQTKRYTSQTKQPITLYIPSELARGETISKYFSDVLRARGFRVTTQLIAWADFMKRYNEKSMQAFLFSMNADYPDTEFLARNFESDNPDNFSGIKSAKLDDLIRRARKTDSRIERAVLYRDFAKSLNEQALSVNLFHYRAHYWFSECVRGIELNSLGDVYIPYRLIFLDPKCEAAKTSKEVARVN